MPREKEPVGLQDVPRRIATNRLGQWLYLFDNAGVLFSESLSRFAGLSPAGAVAYQAFDAGASLDELLQSRGVSPGSGETAEELEQLYALSQGIFPDFAERDPWPALQTEQTANLKIDDIPVLVEFPQGPLEELCRDYFRNFALTSKPAKHHLSAQQDEHDWTIFANGNPFLTSLDDSQLGLGFMHAARSLLYAEAAYDVAFHAGMVANNHAGVMLCAPREAGKSTLAAYLLSHGFDLLADEPTLLDLDTRTVASLNQPVSLKEGSWAVLSEHQAQLQQSPVHMRSDGIRIRLLHPPTTSHRSTSQLTHIVFPEYRPSSPTEIEKLRPIQALTLLNESGMILAKDLPLQKFETLLSMLCTTPACTLKYASLPGAFAFMSEFVRMK